MERWNTAYRVTGKKKNGSVLSRSLQDSLFFCANFAFAVFFLKFIKALHEGLCRILLSRFHPPPPRCRCHAGFCWGWLVRLHSPALSFYLKISLVCPLSHNNSQFPTQHTQPTPNPPKTKTREIVLFCDNSQRLFCSATIAKKYIFFHHEVTNVILIILIIIHTVPSIPFGFVGNRIICGSGSPTVASYAE